MTEKNIEDELWELAHDTPAKHYKMYIIDEITGIMNVTDQTMDCRLVGPPEVMERVITSLVNIVDVFSTKSYLELFGDRNIEDVRIDTTYIKFEGVSGEKAFVLLTRYCKVLRESMINAGVLKWVQGSEQKE